MTSFPDLRMAALEYLAAEPDEKLYLLIDNAGLPGLHLKLRECSLQWVSLFDESREIGALAAAPILILIGFNSALKITSPLLTWISEKGAHASCITMLASPQTIGTVRERLSKRLDVKLSGDMDAILRFYDPRILQQLVKALSVQQAKRFFSAGTKWWWVDRGGVLSGFATEFHIADHLEDALTLEQDQEDSLLKTSEPDQVMYLLGQAAPQLEARLPPNKYGFVVMNINSAIENGLTSTADFTLFCVVALLHGVNFPALPYWSNGLSNVRARRMTFSEVVAGSPEIEL